MGIPLKYNVRNLRVRWPTTLMTVVGIGLVVWAPVIAVGLIVGLMAGFGKSADDRTLIVLRQGANSETESFFSVETAKVIESLPGIESGPEGEPLVSPEVVVVTNTPRRGDGGNANLVVRGVGARARELRPGFHLVAGRDFRPGVREAIASRRIADRFDSAGLGESLPLRRGGFEIVGIFEADGPAGSEVWTDAGILAQDQSRSGSFSSLRLRATDAAALAALETRIGEDEQIALNPIRETEYFQSQAQAAGAITGVGMLIAIILTVGAMFAAANTMYAAVAARAREIGTLRALGFRRRSILASFLIESVVLCLLGGVLGCLLALPVNGLSTGTASWFTFSEIAFSFQIDAGVVLTGLLLATVTGILGGLFPATRAVRLKIVDSLRAL